MIRMTDDEYKALTGKAVFEPWTPGKKVPKASKYHNTRTQINGITFDSKHEAEVWLQLEDMRKRGEIKYIKRQFPFELAGGAYKYVCDFLVIDKDDKVLVIDAKSDFTRQNRVYINKKKQMFYDYKITIVEM